MLISKTQKLLFFTYGKSKVLENTMRCPMHPIITQIGQNSRDEPRPKRIPSQIHNAQVFIDVEISTHHCPFQKYPARQNFLYTVRFLQYVDSIAYSFISMMIPLAMDISPSLSRMPRFPWSLRMICSTTIIAKK